MTNRASRTHASRPRNGTGADIDRLIIWSFETGIWVLARLLFPVYWIAWKIGCIDPTARVRRISERYRNEIPVKKVGTNAIRESDPSA